MNIQILLIIIIPVLLIYTTMIFCYGYKKGHDDGFEIAKRIRDIDDKAESEVENADSN